jgi:hypothetical protein
MVRAKDQEFGTPGHGSEGATDAPYISSVAISQDVRGVPCDQRSSLAWAWGDLPFGYAGLAVLRVTLVNTVGAAAWHGPSSRATAEVGPRFALGWREAVQRVFSQYMAWTGNGVTHARSGLVSSQDDLRLFGDAFDRGVVDDRSIPLMVSWRGAVRTVRAYRCDIDGGIQEREVSDVDRCSDDMVQLFLVQAPQPIVIED